MKLTGNTILVTGGGSGIGRGLAESLHQLGNKVIVAGRRQNALDQTTKANPGIVSINLDVNDPEAIRTFAARLTTEHPGLNVLINNAGIMKIENLKAWPAGLGDSEAVITRNLLGPFRLTAALLPLLQNQAQAAIINVSSGLGFGPLPITPTYSATKAALQSASAIERSKALNGEDTICPRPDWSISSDVSRFDYNNMHSFAVADQ